MASNIRIWCVGIGFDSPASRETVSSGVSIFSEYCTEALGTFKAVAGPSPVSSTPVETSAGKTTTDPTSSPTKSTFASQTSGSSPPAAPASSSSSSTSSSASSSSSSGLSLGEKLAIGVTIPATLAAIVGCYFAWRQHARTKKEAQMRQAAMRQSQLNPGPPNNNSATR
ncbi:hypothetical protein VTL71DRAFT_14155 [Oculimacula yallundae]|uniref:Uncharacterized protein n=1 Tax=Oculimacula yallundae TaxID=86028 RepID=A0ABR4CHN5_9HELO